ncbi:hypothetical protein C7387_3170 [Yokenella regensburgei]|uniref:DUF2570 domain-containing protein n=1 Tax=Yokenella regensburgei TaxID=158877 RepID=A0ABX9RUM4_9ENTR|nr:hypothetical protein [Yokenella regensburgei]RKR53701.1 hypothetical protein C7387_3170 [Yokenella regensburgei]VFS15083.1 Uncharacterised protein [Yokenella regensburgei]
MNESASFMEIPEMKESVRPVRSKLWAIVRYGLGGLVLFALGGTTFISLKQVQLLSVEVSQLKTALQGSPDIAPLQAQLTTLQQQFEASQMQLGGMADKPALAALQQKIEALEITADINCKRATERDRRNFLSARKRLQERVNCVLASGEVCHG